LSSSFSVFGLSAEEVGNFITDFFGKKVRIEILQILDRELGKARIAQAAGILIPTLANVLERRSLGEKLSRKIFTGVAREYPEVLKVALETVLEKYRVRLESTFFGEVIEELIKKKKERVKEIIS